MLKLLSIVDLRSRWNYSKAGVHKLVNANNFPPPVAIVSQRKVKLFSEESIAASERDKPWLFDETAKRRRQHLYAILQQIKTAPDPQASLQTIFGEGAKPWRKGE
jgi:hypothetical protein